MSEIKYTNQQAKAIESRGDNLLVSAAAGSGKTMVLVDRVVNLMLEELVDIERFLIVTFTNAAANQMVDKIRDKLSKSIRTSNSKFIRRQLENLNNGNISTMHAFCIKVLREYYEYIGLSPSFKIANRASLAVIKNNAMEISLEKEYEEARDDFISLFNNYCKSDEGILSDLIDNIYNKIQAQINPMEWIEENTLIEEYYIDEILDNIKSRLEDSISVMEIAVKTAAMPGGPYQYIDAYEDDIRQIKYIISLCDERQYSQVIELLVNLKYKRVASIKNDEKDLLNDEIKEAAQKYRKESKDNISKIIKDFGKKDLEQIEYENNLSSQYLQTIERIIKNYDKNFKELKGEENVLDFSDLEHMCLELLNLKEINDQVRGSISYIFYDEYQDINPLQEEIINKIRGENNLFFVGDIKQSIYKFRLADPSLFNNRYKLYSNTDEGRVIDLSDNFRSSPTILKYLNYIFRSLMTQELGEIDYRAPGQALSWDKSKEANDSGMVTIVLNEEKKDKEYGELNENARYIGEEIKRLVSQGREYRDIVVLLRNIRNRIGDYEDAFSQLSIPFYSDVSGISLEEPEVSIVIDFLRVINNYRNDSSLISILLTPIGNMDEEELAKIRAANKNISVYESLINYEEDNALKDKIEKFFNRIGSYRKKQQRMKLSDFIYYILEDTAYLAYISAKHNGEESLENIYAFIGRVEDYEEISYSSLGDFLSYVDSLLTSPSESLEPTKLLSENDNVVRIMTIHKSKGLEFPIVFLTDMERQIKLLEKSDNFIIDDEYGIGLNLKDFNRKTSYKTAHRKMIDYKKEQENLSEELRLLYVGATRAEDSLYLVGRTENPDEYLNNLASKPLNYSISKSRSMMDWYMSVSIRDKAFNSQLDFLNRIEGQTSYFDNSNRYKILINPYKKMLKSDERPISINNIMTNKDKLSYEEFDKVFKFSYGNTDKVNKPFKTTVSELSAKNRYKTDDTAEFPKLYKEESFILDNIPDILKSDQLISPLARGSLIHFVFQNISYQKHSIESVKEELERMLYMELLTEEEVGAIDPKIIVDFFNTNLASRALDNLDSLEKERSFTMKIEDMYIDGQIDAYFKEDGGIVMYDFKTDRTISKSRYKDQMLYYKRALDLSSEEKVKEIYIYWTQFNQTMEIEI